MTTGLATSYRNDTLNTWMHLLGCTLLIKLLLLPHNIHVMYQTSPLIFYILQNIKNW